MAVKKIFSDWSIPNLIKRHDHVSALKCM